MADENLELQVFSYADPTQYVDMLPNRSVPVAMDELTNQGAGSFNVPTTDEGLVENPDLLEYRNVVKFVRNGSVEGAMVINNKVDTLIDTNEDASKVVAVSGEGLKTWFRDAVVYPFSGLKLKSATERIFSWASPRGFDFIPANWVSPFVQANYEMVPPKGSTNPWKYDPANWPDAPHAQWVWGLPKPSANYNQPAGYCYFRYDFNIADATAAAAAYSFFMAADDSFTAYLDGEVIITSDTSTDTHAGFDSTYRYDTNLGDLTVGPHTFAVKVNNKSLGPGGLLATFWEQGNTTVTPNTAAKLLSWTGKPTTANLLTTLNAANANVTRVENLLTSDGVALNVSLTQMHAHLVYANQLVQTRTKEYYSTPSKPTTTKKNALNALYAARTNLTQWQGRYNTRTILNRYIVAQTTAQANYNASVAQDNLGAYGWSVNAYPAQEPGWTPGGVLLTLIEEAAARGVRSMGWLTPTFTNLVDSNGIAWDQSIPWTLNVGDDYLTVVTSMEELAFDVWIDPATYELNAYGTRGTDRSFQNGTIEPITLEEAKNLTQASQSGQSDIKNYLVLNTNDGWLEQTSADTTSVEKYGRLEGELSTSAPTLQSQNLATLALATNESVQTSSTYSLIPVEGAWPLRDFFVGDYVLAPDDQGNLVKRRVLSISTTETTDSGQPAYTLEFDTIYQSEEALLTKWLGIVAGGGLSLNFQNSGLPTITAGKAASTPISDSVGSIPAAPVNVAVETAGVWQSTDGQPVSSLSVSWDPVTVNADGSDLGGVSSYKVLALIVPADQLVSIDDDGTTPTDGTEPMTSDGSTDDPDAVTPVNTSSLTTLAEVDGTVTTANVVVPATAVVQLYVQTVVTPSQISDVGEAIQLLTDTPADDDQLAQPSAPVVTSSLGTVTVAWDGLLSSGYVPLQFSYLVVEMSTSADGTFTQVGTPLSDAGDVVVTKLTIGTEYFFQLVAYDKLGSPSPASVTNSVTVTGIAEADLDAEISTAITNAANAASAAQTAADNANTAAGDAQTAASDANTAALNAVGIANGKGKVIYASTAPTGADANTNNLWISTPDNIPHTYNGTTWVAVTDSTATNAASVAAAAQTTANNAASTAAAAATAAGAAQTTANGKNTVWYASTAPAGTAHTNGDLWFNTSSGNAISVWNGTAWALQQLGTAAIANLAITAAQIAASTITTTQLASGAVAAGNIAAGAVDTTKLATAVSTAITTAQTTAAAASTAAAAAQTTANGKNTATYSPASPLAYMSHAWLGTAWASQSTESVNGVVTRTNLVTDPAARQNPPAVGTLGWSTGRWFGGVNASDGTTATGTYTKMTGRTDGPLPALTSYLRKQWTLAKYTGSGDTGFNLTPTAAASSFAVIPGLTYTFSTYLRVIGTPHGTSYMSVSWYNSAGTLISTINGNNAPLDGANWSRRSVTGVAPTAAAFIIVISDVDGTEPWAVGDILDGTGFMLETSATLGTYFDGATDAVYAWTGTQGNSTSTLSYGGVLRRTNLAVQPIPLVPSSPFGIWGWGTRWSGGGTSAAAFSIVTGAADGPVLGIDSYIRKTWTATNDGSTAFSPGDVGWSLNTGAALNGVPVTAGQVLTFSSYVRATKATNTGSSVHLIAQFWDATGAQVGANTNGTGPITVSQQLVPNVWFRVWSSFTVPAGAVFMNVFENIYLVNVVVGDTLDGTALLVESSVNPVTDGTTIGPWFDGDTASSLAPAGTAVNDLWFQTSDGNKIFHWDGSNWVLSTLGSNAIANNAITAQQIAANTITTTQIAAGAVAAGNIAANAVDATKLSTDISTTISTAASQASSGLAIATSAQLTANGKNTITYSTAIPSAMVPGAIGDTWYQRTTAGIIIGQWEWEGAGVADASVSTQIQPNGTTATNLATNPSFETFGANTIFRTNLSPNPQQAVLPTVYQTGANPVTLTTVTGVTDHPAGIQTATRVSYVAGQLNPGISLGISAVVGTVYTMSAWIKNETVGAGLTSAGFAVAGDASSADTTFPTTWTRMSWTHTATLATALGFRELGTATGSGSFLISGVLIEASDTLRDYFDGSTTPTYAWLGAANASASTMSYEGAVQRTNLSLYPNMATTASTTSQSWVVGGGVTVARTAEPDALYGWALKVTATAASAYAYVGAANSGTTLAGVAGLTLTAQVRVRQLSGTLHPFAAALVERNSAGSAGGQTTSPTTVAPALGQWFWLTVTRTIAAGVDHVQLQARTDVAAVGDIFEVDAVYIGTDTGAFFDGNTVVPSDYTNAWTGAVAGSTSTISHANASGTGGAGRIQSTLWALKGTKSLRIVPTTTSSSDTYGSPGGDTGALRLGLTAGQWYTFIATAYLPAAQTGTLSAFARKIVLYNKVGTAAYTSVSSTAAPNAAGAYEVRLTAQVPVGSVEAFVRLYNGASYGNGDIYWDQMAIVPVADAAHPYTGLYFDGSSEGAWWGTGSWISKTLDNAVIANLDAGKLTAGYISADRIAANSITAGKLAADSVTAQNITIGDFTNMASGSDFENAATIPWLLMLTDGFSILDTTTPHMGAQSLKVLPTAGIRIYSLDTPLDATPGDQWYFEFWARTDAAWNGVAAANSKLRLGDQSGNVLTAVGYVASLTWQFYSLTYVVPTPSSGAGVTAVQPSFRFDHTAGNIWIDDVVIRKKVAGSLIVDGTVTATQIAANTITAGQILAGTITSAQIAANTITAADIAANTITAGQIAVGTITASSGIIGNAAIVTANIATAAITTAQIADATITSAKIASIDAGKITTGTLSAGLIASGTITSDMIAAGTITASDIAAATITGDRLVANTITAGQIAASTITSNEIAANTITAGQILAGTITSAQIAANTITAGQILAGTITTTEIATGTIQAADIATGTITATSGIIASLDGGVITANSISGTSIKAQTITASLMEITAPQTNLLVGGDFEEGPTGQPWPLDAYASLVTTQAHSGTHSLQLAPFTSSRSYVSPQYPVVAGDTYQLTYWVYTDAAYSGTLNTAVISSSNTGSLAFDEFPNGSVTDLVWTKHTQTYVMPVGATILEVILLADQTAGNIYFDDFNLVDVTPGGSLIVDGSILAQKIAANTITANQIQAGTITTNEIQAGTITTSDLSATAINGMTITGALIQTAATGARTELTSQGMHVLAADGVTELVKVGYGIATGMSIYDSSSGNQIPLSQVAFGSTGMTWGGQTTLPTPGSAEGAVGAALNQFSGVFFSSTSGRAIAWMQSSANATVAMNYTITSSFQLRPNETNTTGSITMGTITGAGPTGNVAVNRSTALVPGQSYELFHSATATRAYDGTGTPSIGGHLFIIMPA
jgi:hypothetical protein